MDEYEWKVRGVKSLISDLDLRDIVTEPYVKRKLIEYGESSTKHIIQAYLSYLVDMDTLTHYDIYDHHFTVYKNNVSVRFSFSEVTGRIQPFPVT